MAGRTVKVYLPNSYMQSEKDFQRGGRGYLNIVILFRNSLPNRSSSLKHEDYYG